MSWITLLRKKDFSAVSMVTASNGAALHEWSDDSKSSGTNIYVEQPDGGCSFHLYWKGFTWFHSSFCPHGDTDVPYVLFLTTCVSIYGEEAQIHTAGLCVTCRGTSVVWHDQTWWKEFWEFRSWICITYEGTIQSDGNGQQLPPKLAHHWPHSETFSHKQFMSLDYKLIKYN